MSIRDMVKAMPRMTHTKKALLTAGAVLMLLAAGTALQPASSTHMPANKAAVAASSFEVLGTPVSEGASSEVVTLMDATMRATRVTDLVLSVTLECSIWTNVFLMANGDSEAIASVNVWVELDGVPVPVSSDDTESPGEAVFCNRAYRVVAMGQDNESQFDFYLSTKSANSFNWITTNIGSGIHTLEVKARLDAEVTGLGEAQAGIGKRTFIAEPIALANDVTV